MMEGPLVMFVALVGTASLITMPLATVIGLPLLAWNVRAWIRLKERELDLKRLETATRIRCLTTEALPEYVDASDPEALLAWARADREMHYLS